MYKGKVAIKLNSALIVSCTDQGTSFFTELLNAADIKQIAALRSVAEARRLLTWVAAIENPQDDVALRC